jgi:hypothetical protein
MIVRFVLPNVLHHACRSIGTLANVPSLDAIGCRSRQIKCTVFKDRTGLKGLGVSRGTMRVWGEAWMMVHCLLGGSIQSQSSLESRLPHPMTGRQGRSRKPLGSQGCVQKMKVV